MRFPVVSGSNLLRQKLTLPDDLQGDVRLVFIAFQQRHQALVDSWLPTARRLEAAVPGVQYYELPVIQKMSGLARTFINEGMRAGIPNSTARLKTITLYLDKLSFRTALDIPDEDTIQVLVLDRQGNVTYRTDGPFSPDKAAALNQAVREQAVIAETPA